MTATVTAERYVCSECRHETGKWMGFCPQCRQPGTLEATVSSPNPVEAMALVGVTGSSAPRLSSGLREFDRTLGGGFVPGAAVVVGGEPGIGKSTLLLQVAGAMADSGSPVLIATAEESAEQVALRAARIEGSYDGVHLVVTDDIDEVIAAAERLRARFLIVDSIQTVADRNLGGTPGSPSQVRECGARLVAFAKRSGTPTVLIGHVTKDGSLAGPKLLEHAVDVVLYLEGDAHSGLRFLRGLKNRFGATPSLGFFEMADAGLREVADPSGVLGVARRADVPGAVLFPAIEGRRPLMVEVQALVASASAGMPRRSVKGLESARLHQVLAVLERHAGLDVGSRDVYVAVAGGVRVREPGADLAVALAVASSLLEAPLVSTAVWGEVGLTGEVRAVSGHDSRLAEAQRLGVGRVVAPRADCRLLSDAIGAAGLPRDLGWAPSIGVS